MTTLTDEPRARSCSGTTPAERLRQTMAAARISFRWFGVRKALTPEQRAEAAGAFDAEGQFLSAGKKLLDNRDPRFKAVTAVRNRTVGYWRAVSLPYTEAGIRLIRQDRLDAFQRQMTELQTELEVAVRDLDRHLTALTAAARVRLGRLYNPADYPDSLSGLFAMEWDFPSVEPPSYLQQLSPALFVQESRRVAARFDEAVRLAEQAFLEELSRLVSHLTERLSGSDDGQPKIFRDSAMGNLREFFERFRSLNVRSNEQLDDLVEACQRIVAGVEPQQLRDSQPLRDRVTRQLSSLESTLDGLLTERPRRRILRAPK